MEPVEPPVKDGVYDIYTPDTFVIPFTVITGFKNRVYMYPATVPAKTGVLSVVKVEGQVAICSVTLLDTDFCTAKACCLCVMSSGLPKQASNPEPDDWDALVRSGSIVKLTDKGGEARAAIAAQTVMDNPDLWDKIMKPSELPEGLSRYYKLFTASLDPRKSGPDYVFRSHERQQQDFPYGILRVLNVVGKHPFDESAPAGTYYLCSAMFKESEGDKTERYKMVLPEYEFKACIDGRGMRFMNGKIIESLGTVENIDAQLIQYSNSMRDARPMGGAGSVLKGAPVAALLATLVGVLALVM